MAYIKTLFKKDLNDNNIPGDENTLVYPVTTTSAVFDGTTQTLDNTLTEIKNDIQDLKENGVQTGTKSTGVIIMSKFISLGLGNPVNVSINPPQRAYIINFLSITKEQSDYWLSQHQAENVIIVWDKITSTKTINILNSNILNLNTLEFKVMDITDINDPLRKDSTSLYTVIPQENKSGTIESNYPVIIRPSQEFTITLSYFIES